VTADEEQYEKEEVDYFRKVLEIIHVNFIDNICRAICAWGGYPVRVLCVLSRRGPGCSDGSRWVSENQCVGGVLTHSWLPCGLKEETITLMGKSIVSCSTNISYHFISII